MEDTDDVYIKFENNKTPALNDIFWNNLQRMIREDIRNNGGGGGDSEEIGSVKLWFSNTIPTNWLLLNGQAISRTEYSELFEILGTTYGAGDGSTTFNLPDMRGYVPVGLKSDDDTFNVLGKKVGEKKHTMTIQELIEHYHVISRSYGGTEGATYEGEAKIQAAKADGGWTSTAGRTASSGGGQPFNVIQPSFVCNFIVKAKKEKTVQKDLTLTEVLKLVFPVGSTYTTQANTNPSATLGFGTWERLKGKVIVGLDEDDTDGYFNEIGKTGGEKKHAMTLAEMKEHRHGDGVQTNFLIGGSEGQASCTVAINKDMGATAYAGGNQPFNVVQPYEVVGYMWIRRA